MSTKREPVRPDRRASMPEDTAKDGPSRAKLNTQRLSAMIDSLHNENDIGLFQSPTTTTADAKLDQNDIGKPPSRLLRSPAGDVSLPPGDNRSSMISNYSGVIQEGVEVSYIVKNQQQSSEPYSNKSSPLKQSVGTEILPQLPMLPSEATLTKHLDDDQSMKSRNGEDEVVIRPVTNAKPVGRFNSSTSKKVESRGSLKLLSNPRRQEKVLRSSIGSGNLASESGSSTYNPTFRQSIQEQLEEEDDSNASDKLSIVSSVIPDLSTKTNGEPKEMSQYVLKQMIIIRPSHLEVKIVPDQDYLSKMMKVKTGFWMKNHCHIRLKMLVILKTCPRFLPLVNKNQNRTTRQQLACLQRKRHT